MNQLLKPAIQDRARFGGEPFSEISIDTCDRPAGRIEYDDGDPATIVPADRRDVGDVNCIRWAHGVDRAASFRAPVARVAGSALVEYDDGNPATIAAAAD